jgi:uncharacterized protein YgbK (DUF1537 family)
VPAAAEVGTVQAGMVERLLLLADDFTGACDAAAPFAATGETLVLLHADRAAAAHAVVTALDLDLRERADEQARAATSVAARQYHQAASALQRVATSQPPPVARTFLKIDSTLRGPIAGLLDGALQGTGAPLAILAPAFPEQGRLFEAGRLVLDGQPGPSLSDALGLERTAVLSASFARSAAEVEEAVEHARMRGARRIIVDADGPICLASVAEAWQRHPEWLVVGSAGLARQVAAVAASAPRPRAAAGGQAIGGIGGIGGGGDGGESGPILVVAGSPAAATRAQLGRLESASLWEVASLASTARPTPAEVIVLATPPTTGERDAGQAAQALAEIVAGWAAHARPRAVVLVGGATARATCGRLGVDHVQLLGEHSPGVPLGRLSGGIWHGVTVVTKAGSFGGPETLLDVVHALGVSSSSDDDD